MAQPEQSAGSIAIVAGAAIMTAAGGPVIHAAAAVAADAGTVAAAASIASADTLAVPAAVDAAALPATADAVHTAVADQATPTSSSGSIASDVDNTSHVTTADLQAPAVVADARTAPVAVVDTHLSPAGSTADQKLIEASEMTGGHSGQVNDAQGLQLAQNPHTGQGHWSASDREMLGNLLNGANTGDTLTFGSAHSSHVQETLNATANAAAATIGGNPDHPSDFHVPDVAANLHDTHVAADMSATHPSWTNAGHHFVFFE